MSKPDEITETLATQARKFICYIKVSGIASGIKLINTARKPSFTVNFPKR